MSSIDGHRGLNWQNKGGKCGYRLDHPPAVTAKERELDFNPERPDAPLPWTLFGFPWEIVQEETAENLKAGSDRIPQTREASGKRSRNK